MGCACATSPARNHILQGDLQSFIMAPIQRIMRYPLLLEALLKRCSPVIDVDYGSLQRAYQVMQSMAVRADAYKEAAARQARWTQLLAQFPPPVRHGTPSHSHATPRPLHIRLARTLIRGAVIAY